MGSNMFERAKKEIKVNILNLDEKLTTYTNTEVRKVRDEL